MNIRICISECCPGRVCHHASPIPSGPFQHSGWQKENRGEVCRHHGEEDHHELHGALRGPARGASGKRACGLRSPHRATET